MLNPVHPYEVAKQYCAKGEKGGELFAYTKKMCISVGGISLSKKNHR